MKPRLHLDFTKSIKPVSGKAPWGGHGDLPAPQGKLDRKRGLKFPLRAGGCMLASGGIMDDAAGSLEIGFTPEKAAATGVLVQAWGQYAPLLELCGDTLKANVYSCPADMLVRLEAGVEYTVRFSWHHECGFTLAFTPRGGACQTLSRRHRWKAFRQQYVPFSIGGTATAPRYRKWAGSFAGWVSSVKLWRDPQDGPGPVEIGEAGGRIAPPFDPAPEVKVLELDDPPIRPDPLGLVQLPDRSLADLRRTRELCGLDEVVSKCKTELEIFTRLTWHLGTLWPHCNYWPWPGNKQRLMFWKRGHEIIPQIQAGKAGGMCGGYAHMMEEVFWSFGFDARRIQVRSHSSFEAYLNEQDRWIICDASWNDRCHLIADGHGCFLGCGDLIRRYEEQEYNPRALSDVHPLICREENLGAPAGPLEEGMSAAIGAYRHLGVETDKTAAYGRKTSTAVNASRMAWYLRACERDYFRAKEMGMGQSILVDRLEDLYPGRNRAQVALRWRRRGASLTLTAKPVGVTFFDTLLMAVDGEAEKPFKGAPDWNLHPGVNTLTVRTRNRLGARGYPFRIRLWKS